MAEKTAAKKTARRGSQRRRRITTGTDARYVRRTAAGRFKESDDIGRSQRTDRATNAKRTVKAGYGDQGNRPRTR
jgi:hypothetical protein